MGDSTWAADQDVLSWLKLSSTASSEKLQAVEACLEAAAEWISEQRPDLMDPNGSFQPTARMFMALKLVVARLYARMDSPNGVVSFNELGAGSILSNDPDVARLLGRAKWRVG